MFKCISFSCYATWTALKETSRTRVEYTSKFPEVLFRCHNLVYHKRNVSTKMEKVTFTYKLLNKSHKSHYKSNRHKTINHKHTFFFKKKIYYLTKKLFTTQKLCMIWVSKLICSSFIISIIQLLVYIKKTIDVHQN